MAVVLFLLAFAMAAMGAAAVASGWPYVQVERGWTMVISGSVVASAGALLFGVALAAQRLGRIAGEAVQIRDRLAQIEELTALRVEGQLAAVPVAAGDDLDIAGPGDAFAPPPERLVETTPVRPVAAVEAVAPPPVSEPQPVTVVGQYASGGNSYTMFSDGSIRAETPSGQRRFTSLDELRAFVAGGGEKAA